MICQANLFRDPKLHFTTTFGVATHRLRNPELGEHCGLVFHF